ncbi:hypothetical protein [Elizabethkingia phage TCUEAP1]|nr:hypothetical protein [Elizabethkingia phage TCUEAP1]
MKDGFFIVPYTAHDYIVLSFALSGTLLRILVMYKIKDSRNPSVSDWVWIFLISFILTIGLYELAIHKNWEIEPLYIPFAIIILISKDVIDWIVLSDDGKQFVIKTFKNLITGLARKIIANETNTNITTDDPVNELRDETESINREGSAEDGN